MENDVTRERTEGKEKGIIIIYLIVTSVVRWCGDHTCKRWADSESFHNHLWHKRKPNLEQLDTC